MKRDNSISASKKKSLSKAFSKQIKLDDQNKEFNDFSRFPSKNRIPENFRKIPTKFHKIAEKLNRLKQFRMPMFKVSQRSTFIDLINHSIIVGMNKLSVAIH